MTAHVHGVGLSVSELLAPLRFRSGATIVASPSASRAPFKARMPGDR